MKRLASSGQMAMVLLFFYAGGVKKIMSKKIILSSVRTSVEPIIINK